MAAGVAPRGAAQSPASAQADIDEVIAREAERQRLARQEQVRIDQLDDETLALLVEFRAESARLADLDTYNANLREMLASQAAEKQRLQQAARDIETVRREIVPLLVEMISTLEQFVVLDLPFLPEERQRRIAALRDLLARADVTSAEKFRRVIEAYQVEAEYGLNIEAWAGELKQEGRTLTVDYLRLGRVALYYVSLDRESAAIYDPARRRWQLLPKQAVVALDRALRVARRQSPADLLALPLWTGDNP